MTINWREVFGWASVATLGAGTYWAFTGRDLPASNPSVSTETLCTCGHPKSEHAGFTNRGSCGVCYEASDHGLHEYCHRFRGPGGKMSDEMRRALALAGEGDGYLYYWTGGYWIPRKWEKGLLYSGSPEPVIKKSGGEIVERPAPGHVAKGTVRALIERGLMEPVAWHTAVLTEAGRAALG